MNRQGGKVFASQASTLGIHHLNQRRYVMRAKSLALVLILLTIATMAMAETASWEPSTSWTDNTGQTGTFTSSEMATMTYYLWAAKAGQARSKVRTIGPGNYTVSGAIASWTGDLKTILGAKSGESWDFTVSQEYTDADGVARESAESGKYTYLFPFPPGRTPGTPQKTTVKK